MELTKSKILSSSILEATLILSCLTLLKAGASENRRTAVEVDQGATDGEEFVRRIVHGEKITGRPEYLLFTAPYRLCKGGCPNARNFVLSFPLYIGKKGRTAYQTTYQRDALKIHSMRPNAPFRMRTSRTPMTTCPTLKETKKEDESRHTLQNTQTETTTEATTTTTTETTTTTKATVSTEAAITRTAAIPLKGDPKTDTADDSDDPDLIDLLYIENDSTKKPCKNFTGLCLHKKKRLTTPGFKLNYKIGDEITI